MTRQAQLGLFAVFALMLLFGIFYVVTDFGTRHSGYRIGVHFSTAAGLPTGAQVFFSGVTVGTVDQVQLMQDNTVDVILAIQNGINIPRDSRFLIQAPLTGTPSLMIVPPIPRHLPPGYTATPLPEEAILPKEVLPIEKQPVGTPVASIADLMQQGQGEVRRLDHMLALLSEREPVLLNTLQTALSNMDDITTEFRGTVADLSGTLNGTMRQAGSNIVSMTSTMNDTLSRNQYRIDALLASLDSTAVALNKSMDQLQSLASDPRLKANLLDTTSNIRDLTANIAGVTGDLRTISGNPQTQAQLRDTVANLDATMQKADSLLGTLGGRSRVYGVDAGATPYPIPKGPGALPPPGSETPPPAGAGGSLRAGLSHIAANLFAVQARMSFLNAQSVKGPSSLLTSDRGPQTDLNAILLPRGNLSAMAGINDIGGQTTWNLAAIKNSGCIHAGGGVLYSQIGVLASCNGTHVGAETRIYDLRRPTFDIYGNLNVLQWAQLFLGERDATRSDRRTVYGLQLNLGNLGNP
ncbi:MAG TPA: MlaD family protein [Candidatus Baltobacteraceae bacterium]|nr:MlaD family protein [Candidatus Baltobacteraceae bacterium]